MSYGRRKHIPDNSNDRSRNSRGILEDSLRNAQPRSKPHQNPVRPAQSAGYGQLF